MSPVLTFPQWALGLLLMGATGLLAFFVVFLLVVFVRESRQRRLW